MALALSNFNIHLSGIAAPLGAHLRNKYIYINVECVCSVDETSKILRRL